MELASLIGFLESLHKCMSEEEEEEMKKCSRGRNYIASIILQVEAVVAACRVVGIKVNYLPLQKACISGNFGISATLI
uniref:Uncharacterized protein n=1 Tax=Oryza sativa subsp. japonica TaxID=39947 RepID=Q7F0Q1_ORYSJ|nr:hypothetical protein [Oryza sativa Japonica Group]